MINWLKKQGRLIMRYYFWIYVDRPSLHWNEFWISKDFQEYLKFRKYARWHNLYTEEITFNRQPRFVMVAMLHDYFVHLGYTGIVETDDFGIKYLIWRYTL